MLWKTSFRISWSLRGEFTGNRWICPQRNSNTELCRFCISLTILLNKYSSCVAINWTDLSKTQPKPITNTPWVPRLHGGRFEDGIFGCISLSENDLIFSEMISPIYGWMNKHWECYDFWYHPLCRTHLIWPSFSIWCTGRGRRRSIGAVLRAGAEPRPLVPRRRNYGHRGQMASMVCGWVRELARACSYLWPSRSI